jgi:hypothetical protein
MDNIQKIASFLKEISANQPMSVIIADVVSIEKDTCTVKLSTGLELPDIRLKSIIDDSGDYFVLTPMEKSKVWLLSISGGLDDLMVIKIDKLKSFEIKQKGMHFLIDTTDGKFIIKNDKADLLTIFSDLSSLIKKLQVSTGTGPSGTPLPPTISALDKLETDFKKLLKSS